MGLVSPYILTGRILFQKTNELKLGWNDVLPDNILKPFEKWRNKLNHLKRIQIPRWTNMLALEDARTDLIIFSDASLTGYGFTAYIRKYLADESKISVNFLFSKSHVVPLNMLKKPVKSQQFH